MVENSEDDFDTVVEAAQHAGITNELVRAVDAECAVRLLEAASAERYAFVLLDFDLPGADGLQLLRWIRSHPSMIDLPAVVLTTSINPRHQADFEKAGADDFRNKGVHHENGLRTLQSIFDVWLHRSARLSP